jgi:hypothetical protein
MKTALSTPEQSQKGAQRSFSTRCNVLRRSGNKAELLAVAIALFDFGEHTVVRARLD